MLMRETNMKKLICMSLLALSACAVPKDYPDSIAGDKMRAFDLCMDQTTGYRGGAEIKACQAWAVEATKGTETKREAAEATSPSTS